MENIAASKNATNLIFCLSNVSRVVESNFVATIIKRFESNCLTLGIREIRTRVSDFMSEADLGTGACPDTSSDFVNIFFRKPINVHQKKTLFALLLVRFVQKVSP